MSEGDIQRQNTLATLDNTSGMNVLASAIRMMTNALVQSFKLLDNSIQTLIMVTKGLATMAAFTRMIAYSALDSSQATLKANQAAFGAIDTGGSGNKPRHDYKSEVSGLKTVSGIVGSFKSQFSSMGPQFAMMAIVMQPVMQFLGALLEPFAMIGDYFEAFGGILAQAFVPIMIQLQPLFDALIPVFMALAGGLATLFQVLFNAGTIGLLVNILTALIPLILAIVGLFNSLMAIINPLMPVFMALVQIFVNFITLAVTPLTAGITWLAEKLTYVGTLFMGVLQPVLDFFERIAGFLKEIAGQNPKDWAIFNSKENGGWW